MYKSIELEEVNYGFLEIADFNNLKMVINKMLLKGIIWINVI
jgi:hypothetical protein